MGLDYWVTGFGTGGTLNGVSRVLRERSPNTQIVVCEPDNSPLLSSGEPQPKDANGRNSQSHPRFRPHLMQGWTPDFIPQLTQQVTDEARIDQFIPINGNDAMHYSRQLARQEGIFVGISAGATFAGALQVAKTSAPGSTILCMLPDTGERYLSTPLFDDIDTEMSAEELELSRSTPGYRFDVSGGASATPAVVSVSEDVQQEVQGLLQDGAQPVLMFALEWCEFCWSVRKLFDRLGIPFRCVDVDSVAYQENNRGGQIRELLRQKTSSVTLPQIFIGGEYVGGCTEVFDAHSKEQLRPRLQALGLELPEVDGLDPYSLLPKWLHPR